MAAASLYTHEPAEAFRPDFSHLGVKLIPLVVIDPSVVMRSRREFLCFYLIPLRREAP